MQYSQKSSKTASAATFFSLAGLLLLCLLFFFWRLDAYTLFDRTETETAEVARQMWLSGDWVTPIFNGIHYFDKPVLLYWLIGAGFQVLGPGEWAARLPSALFATALVIGTWWFARRLVGPRFALFMATMLMANPFVVGLGRTGVTDMGLACFLAGGLYSWYWSYQSGRQSGYLLCFALLGGAVLIKGPIGLLLPVLIVGSFLVWTDRWREVIGAMPWVRGVLLLTAITLPWYILVTGANGWVFIDTFFIHHNVDRFFNVIDAQPGPWYYYLLYTPAGMFPWIVLLPLGLGHPEGRLWLSRDYWRQCSATEQLNLFMALWFGIVLLFVSAATTKLPHYIMPALPALAFLCARVWEDQSCKPGRGLGLALGFAVLVLSLLAAGWLIAPSLIHDPALPGLRSRIEATGAPWLLALSCLLAALAIGTALVRQHLGLAWASCLAAYALCFSTAITLLMPTVEQLVHGSLLEMAEVLHRTGRPGDRIATLGVYAPSLNYYGRIDRIPVYETRAQVLYEMAKPQRLLLVTTDSRLQENRFDLSAHRVLHTAGIYKLYELLPRQ